MALEVAESMKQGVQAAAAKEATLEERESVKRKHGWEHTLALMEDDLSSSDDDDDNDDNDDDDDNDGGGNDDEAPAATSTADAEADA